MKRWLQFARAIDRFSERLGRLSAWLLLAMVLIGAFNAVMRHLGRTLGVTLSSNAYIELQWYLFSLVFLLGAPHALAHNAHVRVDVFYSRLAPRWHAWINLGGALLFLLPLTASVLWLSWPSVHNSWSVREVSADPGGLPRYPIKAMLLVGFASLALQGLAEIVKCVAVLRHQQAETPEEREAV
ncbi:MAG TPA: TRAP transporter small permease subunit [Candidatus Krumholzibacteria bacterium]|nr:TRAP transporter small permease subunit [Candidatus Krumholzibacteria bacterium]